MGEDLSVFEAVLRGEMEGRAGVVVVWEVVRDMAGIAMRGGVCHQSLLPRVCDAQ